MTKREGS